jgi:hypothetical protein
MLHNYKSQHSSPLNIVASYKLKNANISHKNHNIRLTQNNTAYVLQTTSRRGRARRRAIRHPHYGAITSGTFERHRKQGDCNSKSDIYSITTVTNLLIACICQAAFKPIIRQNTETPR